MLEVKMPPSAPAVSPTCKLCRLCARRSGEICVFSRHRGDISLSQQAMLVASLKIVPEDDLPHVVCHACAARLSRCFMFRQRARRAQRRLRTRSTYSSDTVPDCEPESDGGNSYTQSASTGDVEFSDDDHEPENTRVDGHGCSKTIPKALDIYLSQNENNRLSINDHNSSNSSSKNSFVNYCSSKNNGIGYSENDSRSESSTNRDKNCPESSHKKGKSCYENCLETSHKEDKNCHESSHKKDKSCLESSHEKDNSCLESSQKKDKSGCESSNKKDKSLESSHKKDKSCHESSHKNDKGCTNSRNKKRNLHKISDSNCKKSKRKHLNSEHISDSKLNQNETTLDTAINKSDLNEFLENDINELLSDKKLNYKSESTEDGTNDASSSILFNALRNHNDSDSFTKQCKIEKSTEKKKGIDGTDYICERNTFDGDADRIDIDEKNVMSHQNKDNDIKDIIKRITKEMEVSEDVTNSNELVRNDDEVKATRSCDETGDSEAAVIGYRRDSWCESDEEKLFHTALKMSIVRHSQDWEIKRETEACNLELMDSSELALNTMTANATQLKLKVRDDLYSDSPGAPVSSDLVAEEKEVVEKRKSYQCQLCNKSFGVKSLLKKHLSTCWLQISHEKGDAKEEEKSNKQQDDSGVPLPRDSRKGLRGVQKKEKTKRKKDRRCKVCGDVFSGRYQLLVHRRSPCVPVAPAAALREHMCEVCGRTFKQRTVLLQHMGTHSGLKLFTCPLCPKTFTRGAHVHIHMRIHNNVKPFVCETCGRSFTKSSDLLRHRRVHSDARDFPCPLCHKAFKRSGDVVSHMRTHSGQRPYKCEQCCKSYTCHSSLLKHRRNKCALRRPSPAAPCSPREANKPPTPNPQQTSQTNTSSITTTEH